MNSTAQRGVGCGANRVAFLEGRLANSCVANQHNLEQVVAAAVKVCVCVFVFVCVFVCVFAFECRSFLGHTRLKGIKQGMEHPEIRSLNYSFFGVSAVIFYWLRMSVFFVLVCVFVCGWS